MIRFYCCAFIALSLRLFGEAEWRECVEKSLPVEGGRLYEVKVFVDVPSEDASIQGAVGALYFNFFKDKMPLAVGETLLPCSKKFDPFTDFEFLFMDQAIRVGSNSCFIVQARVPDGANRMKISAKAWSKSTHARYFIQSCRPCHRVYDYIDTNTAISRRVIFGDSHERILFSGRLMSENGTPLTATNQIVDIELSYHVRLDSGKLKDKKLSSSVDADGRFRIESDIPKSAYAADVKIKLSNGLHCRIDNLRVYSSFQRISLRDINHPYCIVRDVWSNDKVLVSALVRNVKKSGRLDKVGLIRVECFDSAGKTLPVRSLPCSRRHGPYIYLSSDDEGLLNTRDFSVPENAARIELKVSTFSKHALSLDDVDVRILPICSPDHQLTDWVGGSEVLDSIRNRRDDPQVDMTFYSSILGWSYVYPAETNAISFTCFTNKIGVTPSMDWSMDPYDSLTWQLNYDSCYWIPFLGEGLNAESSYRHNRAYWKSFLRNNQYPCAANKMIFNDHACSARVEAILLSMYGKNKNSQFYGLQGHRLQLRQDSEHFNELMRQLMIDVELIAYNLRSKMFGTHNHNLLMARALLSFSRCFESYEFSKRYKDLALDVILEHLNLMFEDDGFIREQSARYHHWMTQNFIELYAYFKRADLLSAELMEDYERRIVRMLKADIDISPYDRKVLLMGDGVLTDWYAEDKQSVNELTRLIGKRMEGICVDNPDRRSIFAKSGLYVYRNDAFRRYALVDLSDAYKAHGHRDLGCWQYHSNGIRWVSDLGGPFRYNAPEHRVFISSASHTLVSPENRRQASGQAYGIVSSESEVSFRTTVYGADYIHEKKIKILDEVSGLVAKDVFYGAKQREESFVGRIIFGRGVEVAPVVGNENVWKLKCGKACAILKISGSTKEETEIVERQASYEMSAFYPVKSLEYKMKMRDGKCVSAVQINDEGMKDDCKEAL